MDQYPQGNTGGSFQDPYVQQPAGDESMTGAEESSSATITGGYSNHSRPQTSQSADFPSASGAFSSHSESDRYHSPNMAYQQQSMQASRPSSGHSGANGHGQYGQGYQDQNQRQAEASKAQSSVVIKVGMVGDAQIGKTSLMVKYVEGSWDEDYIQTLGTKDQVIPNGCTDDLLRGQFHGKDDLDTKHRNHLLDMGSRRATGIRQYASPGLQ